MKLAIAIFVILSLNDPTSSLGKEGLFRRHTSLKSGPDATDSPSQADSEAPSDAPTDYPSQDLSEAPSDVPTEAPSEVASQVPSGVPTAPPSQVNSEAPSDDPTDFPSQWPSESPSDVPTHVPSQVPSQVPSVIPSERPSPVTSEAPSDDPTDSPSQEPSEGPSEGPTLVLSQVPSLVPSGMPSDPRIGSNLYQRRYLIDSSHSRDDALGSTRTMEIIQEAGGDPFATFSQKQGLLSPDECDMVRQYVEQAPEKEYHRRYFNATEYHEFYFVDIPADELIDIIGKKRTSELVQFLQESVGFSAPVTRVRGMFSPPDSEKHLGYHHDTDKHGTLLIELNDEYTGAELVYLTANGPTILKRSKGSGVVHGSDIVHAVTSQHDGDRFFLFIYSDMNYEGLKSMDIDTLLS